MLDCVAIEPTEKHTHTVIWMHGLGASGNDFLDIIPELNIPNVKNVLFLFPNAPVQPVTLNGGVAMRSWYDIYELSINSKIDRDGINVKTDY